jgi:hypothetical protein
VRITLQVLLNQTRKARESAAHIGMASRKPHPHIARYGNHRRSSTSRTRASASGSNCANPPGCVAGCQDRSRSVRSGRPVTAAAVGHPRTEASNFPRPFPPPRQSAPAQNMGTTRSAVRACRRQVNTTLAATPLRRATSVTFAPGANVSSTIRELDLRSHASRNITRQTRRRSSDAYYGPGSGPKMPRIKKLVLRDPVGVPSSCCTMGPARSHPWRRMHWSRAPSIGSGTFFVAQPWADCINQFARI